MKKKIIKLFKKLAIQANIEVSKDGFDIYNYNITVGSETDTFVYFTGITNTGVKYPFNTDDFFKRITDFALKSQLNKQ